MNVGCGNLGFNRALERTVTGLKVVGRLLQGSGQFKFRLWYLARGLLRAFPISRIEDCP